MNALDDGLVIYIAPFSLNAQSLIFLEIVNERMTYAELIFRLYFKEIPGTVH